MILVWKWMYTVISLIYRKRKKIIKRTNFWCKDGKKLHKKETFMSFTHTSMKKNMLIFVWSPLPSSFFLNKKGVIFVCLLITFNQARLCFIKYCVNTHVGLGQSAWVRHRKKTEQERGGTLFLNCLNEGSFLDSTYFFKSEAFL